VKLALDTFVNSYNGVVDELNKHYGTQKGALAGNSVLSGTNDVLRRISSYGTGTSGMGSLAAIGVLTDKSGKLYIDSTEWDKVSNDVSGLQTFIGSTGTSGFLKSAGDNIISLQADKTGLLKSAIETTKQQATSADNQIAEEQRRIDTLKENLQQKFYAADALIAALEQQASYFISMFTAMKSNQDSMNG